MLHTKACLCYTFSTLEIYIPANFFWDELEIPVKSYPICCQKKTHHRLASRYFILEVEELGYLNKIEVFLQKLVTSLLRGSPWSDALWKTHCYVSSQHRKDLQTTGRVQRVTPQRAKNSQLMLVLLISGMFQFFNIRTDIGSFLWVKVTEMRR